MHSCIHDARRALIAIRLQKVNPMNFDLMGFSELRNRITT
jgi:hypothetical protein